MTSSAYLPRTTRIYSMEGRDARDLLHRLTTVDARHLRDGELRSGFLLSPQGKIRASFRLGQRTSDSFLIEIDAGADGHWASDLLALLDQMTFAEKYSLEDLSAKSPGWKNAWIFDDVEKGTMGVSNEGPLLVLREPAGAFAGAWTSVWGPAEAVDARVTKAGRVLSEEDYEALRIAALVPRADREITAEANPLELGLRGGIADQKGCYPGQEVIEKIVSLGSPAKRLALVRSAAPLAVGAKLYLDAEKKSVAGTVSSSARAPDGPVALALLRKNALEAGRSLFAEGATEARISRIAHYE